MPTPPTIWKYLLTITDEVAIEMPSTAVVLRVDIDPGPSPVTADGYRLARPIALWVHVLPDTPQVLRHFHIVGTGRPLPQGATTGRYLGTAIDRDLGGVWHVFRAGDAPVKVTGP